MLTINEKTTFWISGECKDANGVSVTPSLVTYDIIDVISANVVANAANFTPANSTWEIEITANQNTMVNANLAKEYRKVNVLVEYGDSKQATEEYVYTLKNLSGFTTANTIG